jgi:hypothetical protein
VFVKSHKDLAAGILFATIGLAFAFGSMRYPLGTSARMGPGYFPLLLGLLLTFLGSVEIIKAVARQPTTEGAIGPWPWKLMGYILGANIVFGILIGGLPSIGLPPMGLVAAIVAMTFVASRADKGLSWRSVAVLALILAAGSYLVFILLLRLIVPIWPEFG